MNCIVCLSDRRVDRCERCLAPVCARHAYDGNEYDRESWVCRPCKKPLPVQAPVLRSLFEARLERSIEIARARKAQ